MNLFLKLIFSALFLSLVTSGQNLKTFQTSKTTAAPIVNGSLDEEMWANASRYSDFIQNTPFEGQSPSLKTEVKIAYDDYAIYVGAMLFDTSPDSILHELGNRDDENVNADLFRIAFDTYNTRQDAFVFGVTASGVQIDFKFSDRSFDAVWESAVKINEQGWCVEFAIPYAAIRFPNVANQSWGLNIARDIRRKREFVQWSLTPNAEANFLRFFGNLEGISNIKPPIRLSLTPYVAGYYQSTPEYYNFNEFTYSNLSYATYGADIKYGIDERFTLDATLLPDFGQVQTDNKIKNLSYREVNFSENRPFFKEGSELFDINELFYSRRIGKTPGLYYAVPLMLDTAEKIISNSSQTGLINASKITGRTNKGLGIGILNALTDNEYAVLKDTISGTERKIITEPMTNYNILSFIQQLKNNSSVGVYNSNVNRFKGYNDANVTSAGFDINNKKNTINTGGAFTLSQIFSNTSANSSDQPRVTRGYKTGFGIRKTGGSFEYGINYNEISKDYRQTDLGYFTITNFRNINSEIQYRRFVPYKKIRNANARIELGTMLHRETNKLTDVNIEANSFVLFTNFLGVYTGGKTNPAYVYDYFEPRIEGRYYIRTPYWVNWAGFSTDYRKKLAFDFNYHIANYYAHKNPNNLLNIPGYGLKPKVRYRINDKMSITYAIQYTLDPYNDGFATIDTSGNIIFGGRKLVTWENNLNIKYTINNKMSVQVNSRHYWNTGKYIDFYTLEENGYLTLNTSFNNNLNFNYNAFNFDFVYQWQIGPGSFLTLTYKNIIENEKDYIISKFNDNINETFDSPQSNILSLKVIYFLDYLYLKKLLKK